MQAGDRRPAPQALECLASAVYYEAGKRKRRRRARGRPGRPQPGPPPGLPGERVRRRLPRLDPGHRLPVHLHLRRLARSPARRRRLARAPRRSPRRRSTARSMPRSAGQPIITPIMSFLIGPSTLAKNAVVGAHLFYHWRGGWGRPAPSPSAIRAMRPMPRPAQRRARGRGRDRRPGAAGCGRSGDRHSRASRRCKLTPSMRGDKRVALRFNQTARKAADEAVHKDYVETVRGVRQSALDAVRRNRATRRSSRSASRARRRPSRRRQRQARSQP